MNTMTDTEQVTENGKPKAVEQEAVEPKTEPKTEPKNEPKLTKERVAIVVESLKRREKQADAAQQAGITPKTLVSWKTKALSEPISDPLLFPLRDFLKGVSSEKSEMIEALRIAVTSERETVSTKVTELVKLTPSEKKVLGDRVAEDLKAGDVFVFRREITKKVEPVDPALLVKAISLIYGGGVTGDDEKTADGRSKEPVVIGRWHEDTPSVE